METTYETVERGKLTPLIREMKVGDVVRLPIRSYPTLRTIIYVNLTPERAEGYSWSVGCDLENRQAVVTRKT